MRLIFKSLVDFFRDDGMMVAASVSYFAIMALVPFCLFLMTLFGYLLGHFPEFYNYFLARLSQLFPDATSEITAEIIKLITFDGFGEFGLILYGFLSYQVFASVENGLNIIFKVKKKRRFIFSLLISIAVVTSIIALTLTSFVAASFIPLLKAYKSVLPMIRIGKITEFIIRYMLPFILMLFTLTTVYVLLPRVKVRFADAAKGAFFTAVLFEVAKHLFTCYAANVMHLGSLYGPLTAFILFLLWLYYSSVIFFIGAELVHNLGNNRKI